MDKKVERFLNRISASIPKHLRDNLMKKEYNPDLDTISNALASRVISKENKAKLSKIKDGMLKDQHDIVDPEIEKEIDLYLSTKIEQAIRKGEIPKATKDDFQKRISAKINR